MTFQRERKRSQREVSLVSFHIESALILYPGSEAAEPRSFSFIHLESACQAYGLLGTQDNNTQEKVTLIVMDLSAQCIGLRRMLEALSQNRRRARRTSGHRGRRSILGFVGENAMPTGLAGT